MDKQSFALLIPIIALSIPVVAIVMSSLVKMARLKAESDGGKLAPGAELRMAALEEDVLGLQHELAETQERLDFAERLIAQRRDEPNQLKG